MESAITRNTQDLERLEGVITRNLQSFYEVGRALMEIRNRELYRDALGFPTFEAYCKDRWDFNSSRARQLIAATETYDNLKTVTIVTPVNEGQARPLMALPAEQQRAAWQQAVDTAPDGKVTAAHVYKIVKGMTMEGKDLEPKPEKKMVPSIPEHAVYFATIAITHLERISDDDPTRGEALDMIQQWIDKHR